MCRLGSYVVSAPTLTSDRLCAPCKSDTYQDEVNKLSCKPLSSCTLDIEFIRIPQTVSSDAICGVVTECNATFEWECRAPKKSSDRLCCSLTVCSFPSTYELYPPTSTSDRSCVAVTICNESSTEVSYPTLTSDRICALDRQGNASNDTYILSNSSNSSILQLVKIAVPATAGIIAFIAVVILFLVRKRRHRLPAVIPVSENVSNRTEYMCDNPIYESVAATEFTTTKEGILN